jgi:TPR repeat protein
MGPSGPSRAIDPTRSGRLARLTVGSAALLATLLAIPGPALAQDAGDDESQEEQSTTAAELLAELLAEKEATERLVTQLTEQAARAQEQLRAVQAELDGLRAETNRDLSADALLREVTVLRDGLAQARRRLEVVESGSVRLPAAGDLGDGEAAGQILGAIRANRYSGETPSVTNLRLSALAGDLQAMRILGYRLERGLGVEANPEEGLVWFRRAAKRGDPWSLTQLALFAEQADRLADAAELYRRAARQGSHLAMNNLGAMFERGRGVPQDAVEAAHWYRRAADLGSPVGMTNLGRLHESGRGVEQDFGEAARWYRAALAAGGNGQARRRLEAILRYRPDLARVGDPDPGANGTLGSSSARAEPQDGEDPFQFDPSNPNPVLAPGDE